MKNYYFERPDILVFPVIDWHYRFQRPQQISTRLALRGHRVLYLRTHFLEGTRAVCRPLRDDLPLIDVHLGLPFRKNIVTDQMEEESKRILLEQFDVLQQDLNLSKAICFVDLPFWAPLVLELRKIYGWKIIYDSMDQLSGFSNVSTDMLEPEGELIEKSDLILTTSQILFNEKSRINSNCLLVPNGTDFGHFNYWPENLPDELTDIKRPIVGYYGAMSDWLDTDLIYHLATARPEWSFLLIGRLEGADVSQIRDLDNVFLLGEKPYAVLPGYLQHFDTCIIPFKKTPLTEATNPVKLFEFLSAGKSVVATDLDELGNYREYVRLVSSPEEWLEAIEHALEEEDPAEVERRMSFARQNTWEERMLRIEDAMLSISRDQAGEPAGLPLLRDGSNVVFVNLLTWHERADYWSILYEKDGLLYKQTSFDLAEREARFLSRFESEYFPRPLNVQSNGESSIVTFKNPDGQSLRDALPQINASAAALYSFIQHCLNMLKELQEKGVLHRNIRRENILVQDGRPVLLDFGWAVSEQEQYFSPRGLGGYESPPDGRFSDVYSMGRIFEYVNRRHHPAFDRVISLMTMRDRSLRITDLEPLYLLFDHALQIAQHAELPPLPKALGQLLEQVARRDQKIEWIQSEKTSLLRVLEEKDQVLAERESLLRFTEGRLHQVLDSRAWKIAAWIQRMRLMIVPPESRRARFLERALNIISPASGKTK